jgi:hypothetical protein
VPATIALVVAKDCGRVPKTESNNYDSLRISLIYPSLSIRKGSRQAFNLDNNDSKNMIGARFLFGVRNAEPGIMGGKVLENRVYFIMREEVLGAWGNLKKEQVQRFKNFMEDMEEKYNGKNKIKCELYIESPLQPDGWQLLVTSEEMK